tara:strand:- start:134 stop:961 length:828 start_codon:yes stop_codon:yes gene_type:complete
MVDFHIYEVGPRDGLQNTDVNVPTGAKIDLVRRLEGIGFSGIEVASFVHPKWVPHMADAEQVFVGVGKKHSVLVPNERGMQRALDAGATHFNIFYSPSEVFNKRNLAIDRKTAVGEYRKMLYGIPKENIRVYLSCFFGCPEEGPLGEDLLRECVQEAALLGDTVVLCDTVGMATLQDIAIASNFKHEIYGDLALHLHHEEGDEERALTLVSEAIAYGITTIDSSIGGLGGCPFMPESGGNLATESLVAWAVDNGLDCGVSLLALSPAFEWLDEHL